MIWIVLLMVFFAVCALAFVVWAGREVWRVEGRKRWKTFANAVIAGTVPSHPEGLVTRTLEAKVESRKLLVRQGTAAHEVLLGTASNKPLGVVDDTGAVGERLAVELLGAAAGTTVLIAGGAVAPGDDVFAAAGGKVTTLPVPDGTYWQVGTALTGGADTEEIEVVPCLPRAVVVKS